MSGLPEGQISMQKSALKCSSYNAANQTDFLTHALLEVVYNISECPSLDRTELFRAEKQEYSKVARTTYTRFKYMTVSTGPSARHIKRTVRLESKNDYFKLEDQLRNKMVCFVAVPLPTSEERFLWVDLRYPIRGIYFPFSFEASPKAREWCTYSRLEVRFRTLKLKSYTSTGNPMMLSQAYQSQSIAAQSAMGQLSMMKDKAKSDEERAKLQAGMDQIVKDMNAANPWTKGVEEPDVPPQKEGPGEPRERFNVGEVELADDKLGGWGVRAEWTVRFDVFNLLNILSIPEAYRKKEFENPYDSVVLFSNESVSSCPAPEATDMAAAIDFTKFINEEFGVKLVYEDNSGDKDFIVKALMGLVNIGLSMIPMIGPLVAMGSQLLTDAILDPESFTTAQGLVGKIPGIAGAIAGSVSNTRSFMKEIPAKATPKKLYLEEGADGKSKPVQVGTGEDKAGEDAVGRQGEGDTQGQEGSGSGGTVAESEETEPSVDLSQVPGEPTEILLDFSELQPVQLEL